MDIRNIFSPALALAIALTCFGCQNISQSALSASRQAEIRAEISQVADNFLAALEHVDANAAMAFLADVPEFRHADNEGHLMDYAGQRRGMNGFFAVATSQKTSTKRQEVVVLGPDSALYIWQGSVTVNLKNGAQLASPTFVVNALFKRIDGTWKVLYWQESGTLTQSPKESAVRSAQ